MRLTAHITSSNQTITFPNFINNKWKKIKLIKAFWNAQNISTNRCLFFSIDECDENNFYTASNNIIKYTANYFQEEHYSIGELRLHQQNDNYEWTSFKNERIDKLTINILNYLGSSATDINATNYLLLEFVLE